MRSKLPAFMIPSQHEHFIRVIYLKQNGLDAYFESHEQDQTLD